LLRYSLLEDDGVGLVAGVDDEPDALSELGFEPLSGEDEEELLPSLEADPPSFTPPSVFGAEDDLEG
jgi:hypothetical protein